VIRKVNQKGRAALSNQQKRFVSEIRFEVDDGWDCPDDGPQKSHTTLTIDKAKSIINYNNSPDVGFDRSINPYRGCEHGCIYCFARPTHAYLNLSAGLDFETRLFYKPDAPDLLRKEFMAPGYKPAPIALGINTDAYQPVERRLKLTRRILEILNEFRHPVTIVTKSSLVERDMDILSEMTKYNLVKIIVSVTTLDHDLMKIMEPRACAPARRLKLIENLATAKIPVGVLVAPIIPVLTDHEIESILLQCRNAGALNAGYVLIRLPHEIKQLFHEWLTVHFPDSANHIKNRIRDCRGGRDYDAKFGTRMRGTGVYADLIEQRFKKASLKNGFVDAAPLNVSAFVQVPSIGNSQIELF